MSILSFEFLGFALLLLIAYYSFPLKWRPWVLLTFSVLFVYLNTIKELNLVELFTKPQMPPLKILIPAGILLLTVLTFLIPFKKPQKWRSWVLILAGLALVILSGAMSLIHLSVVTLIVWGGALGLQKLRQYETEMESSGRKLSKAGPMDWADDKDWQAAYRAESVLKNSAKGFVTARKWLLAFLLVLDIGSMAFIKFYPSVAEMLNNGWTKDNPLTVWDLFVPLGLSYFTFQSAGYLIDVSRGKADAPRNPLRTLLFVGYFMQLPQGPISTWKELQGQLTAGQRFDAAKFTSGFQLMIWGYFKKMVLADRLALVTEEALKLKTSLTGWLALGSAVLYGIRLYADFSGGLDVMRGLSRMVGVELPENFRRPFFSTSVAEYWHRWHITLGAWFRSYLLYPLTASKFGVGLGKIAGKVLDVKWGSLLYGELAAILIFGLAALFTGFPKVLVVALCFCGILLILTLLSRRFPDSKFLAKRRPAAWIPVLLFILLGVWRGFSTMTVIFLLFTLLMAFSATREPQWPQKTARVLTPALATVLIFLLIGIWHGISLNAVYFGLYFGLLMAFSTMLDPLWKWTNKKFRLPNWIMTPFRLIRTWALVFFAQFFAFTPNVEKARFMLGKAFDPVTYTLNSVISWIEKLFIAIGNIPQAISGRAADVSFWGALGAHFGEALDWGKVFVAEDAVASWSFETFVSRCTKIMSPLEWIIAGSALLIILVVDIICERKKDFCDGLAKPKFFFIRWPLLILLILAILVFGCYGQGYDSAAFLYTQF